MKKILFIFFGMLCLIFAFKKEQTKTNFTVNYGTSFGMCSGYCKTEVEISAKQIIKVKEAWKKSKDYPKITTKKLVLKSDWKELISLIDFDNFQKLKPIIGCPDCTDGGAEWIEIRENKKVKKVTFEYGSKLKGFEELVKKIRKISKFN